MPNVSELQARLRSLADAHAKDLHTLGDRANQVATDLYRHLPNTGKGDGLYSQLRRSLTAIVEKARTDARNLAASHALAEIRAVAGSKADGLSIPLGPDPLAKEVAEYIDNAVDAAREAVDGAGDEAADAFAGTAYRAHTIIDSESTVAYQRGRAAAHDFLRSMKDSDAVKFGFAIARTEASFRAGVEYQKRAGDDGAKWMPLIGERWSAVYDACAKCRAADGELRPFGFAFSLPGPTVHARCRCIRTIWCVPVPTRSVMSDGRHNPHYHGGSGRDIPRDESAEGIAMGDQARDPDDGGMLRAYTPEEERGATSVNVDDRTVEVVASSEAVDSYDTRFIAEGCDLKRFKKNPIVLSCHNSRDTRMIIGKAADIRVENKRVIVKIKFTPEGMQEEADRVFNLYASDFLRGVSIGFNPLEWEDIEEKGKGRNGGSRYLRTFKRWELVELSAVPVPSNPEALARAWHSLARTNNNPGAAQPNQESQMSDKSNEMVQAEPLRAFLPPEVAAALGVATVEEAVAEIDKRALHADELERSLEASNKALESANAESASKLEAAEKRALDAEKALKDRNDADATAYVDALVKSGGIKEKARDAALRLAIADLPSFRDAHPIETTAAPMAHLFQQVVKPEPPVRAASVVEENPDPSTAQNPIVAEVNRLMKEAEDRGEKLDRSAAFNVAFKSVQEKLTKKSAPAARDRV